MNKLAACAVCLVLASCATQPEISNTSSPPSHEASTPEPAVPATPTEPEPDGPRGPEEGPVRIAASEPDAQTSQPKDQAAQTGPGVPSRRPAQGPPEDILGAGSSRTPQHRESGLPLPKVPPRSNPGVGPAETDAPPPSRGRGRDEQSAERRNHQPGGAGENRNRPPLPLPEPPRPGSSGKEEGDRAVRALRDSTPPLAPGSLSLALSAPYIPPAAPTPTSTAARNDPEPPAAATAAATAPERAESGAAPTAAEQAESAASPTPAEPPASTESPEPAERAPRAEPAAASVDGHRVVQVGDEAEIELSGTGWVYLGEGRNREGLGFRRRYSEGGNTVFVFDVKAAGDYLARFQRQDLEKGVFAERRVAVEGKPAPATGGGEAVAQLGEAPEQGEDRRRGDVVNGQQSGEGQEPEAVDRSASLEEARALLDEGKKEEALEAFLQSYPPGDSEVHDTIASLARDLHRTAVARSHWSENLDAGPPWAQRARMGLLELSLESKDSEGAWEHYAALRDADSEASETALNADSMPQLSAQQLRRLGLLLLDSEDPARAVEPLETYLEGTASPEDPAELFYRLGRLYEQQHRASRALEYYRRVVNDYPLSTHWAPAEERVHYLKRHFFDIR